MAGLSSATPHNLNSAIEPGLRHHLDVRGNVLGAEEHISMMCVPRTYDRRDELELQNVNMRDLFKACMYVQTPTIIGLTPPDQA